MSKVRLEAFSDGVIAILITVMVLELKVPHSADLHALSETLPVFLAYVLSFVYLGIYWNNHHHMLQTARRVSGRVLWANLHLLFWLSLVPFVTGWMGESGNAPFPTACYGAVLLLAGVAYLFLERSIIAAEGEHSHLAAAVGQDLKARLSAVSYAAAVPLSFVHVFIADAIYVVVALLWLIPDPRLERRIQQEGT